MKAWLYSNTTGGLENNLELSTSARTPAHQATANC